MHKSSRKVLGWRRLLQCQHLPAKADVAQIAAKLGAKSILGKEYVVDCGAKLPDLTFTLGGKDYTLTQPDLILQQSRSQ